MKVLMHQRHKIACAYAYNTMSFSTQNCQGTKLK